MDVLPPSHFAVFYYCYFLFATDFKELKLKQAAQSQIGIYGYIAYNLVPRVLSYPPREPWERGYIFYGLTFMLMSKNINNDVTINPPIVVSKRFLMNYSA